MNIGRKKDIESLWRLVVVPGTVGTPTSVVVSVLKSPAPALAPDAVKSSRSRGDGLDDAFGIGIIIVLCYVNCGCKGRCMRG